MKFLWLVLVYTSVYVWSLNVCVRVCVINLIKWLYKYVIIIWLYEKVTIDWFNSRYVHHSRTMWFKKKCFSTFEIFYLSLCMTWPTCSVWWSGNIVHRSASYIMMQKCNIYSECLLSGTVLYYKVTRCRIHPVHVLF